MIKLFGERKQSSHNHQQRTHNCPGCGYDLSGAHWHHCPRCQKEVETKSGCSGCGSCKCS